MAAKSRTLIVGVFLFLPFTIEKLVLVVASIGREEEDRLMPVPTLHLRFIGPRNVPKGIRRGKGARAIFPRRKKKREKIEGKREEKTKRNCFGGEEERRGEKSPLDGEKGGKGASGIGSRESTSRCGD